MPHPPVAAIVLATVAGSVSESKMAVEVGGNVVRSEVTCITGMRASGVSCVAEMEGSRVI